MASSSEISPLTSGGVSRTSVGLTDLSFILSCPPVIQPDTRIIALCGITDWRASDDEPFSDDDSESTKSGAMDKLIGNGKDLLTATYPSKANRQERKEAKMLKARPHGLASPKRDGWFFSDFYLFYHLFRGLGASQRWYTCESSEVLVVRYGQYAHGEAASDHRVVLDKNMLADMKAAGNIHVASPGDLLQEFITYFKAECKTASEKEQPILLMIFGHGDRKTHGIAIGGLGDPTLAPRLRLEHLKTLMRGSNISLTLLTTACYSGGWLVQPNLNISGLSAANAVELSYSWKASLGHSYHGSIWATAVMQSLIKMEDPKITQFQLDSTSVDINRLGQNVQSSNFARLADVIATTLKNEVDARGIHHISFAAQDDEWAKEWRDRSGIPLGRFEAQWDMLPRKAPQAVMAQCPSKAGGIQEGAASSLTAESSSGKNDHGFRKTLTRRQADSILADLCHRYLNSCPPAPETGNDILPYRAAEHFLNQRGPFTVSRASVQGMLSYRLDATDLATTFKDLTLTKGQIFPPCHLFDYYSWISTAAERSKLQAFSGICKSLDSADLLDSPTNKQGYPFGKFYHYLAAAYAENNLDHKAVDVAIATMTTYKRVQVQALTERIRYDRIVRNTARAAFSTLGKRLRSPSPRKRGAIPRFSEEVGSF